MSAELQIGGLTTGWTVYAVLRSATGTVWNGSSFEAFNASNWATYDLALTEQGTTGYYVGNMPAVAAGVYAVEVRRQTGGSPAAAVATDPFLGGGDLDWDGTVLRGAGNVNVAAWGGAADSIYFDADSYPIVSVGRFNDGNNSYGVDVTGNVNVDAIGTVSAGGITAASFAANAITATALAADAGTEIGTAVWANATRTLTSVTGLTIQAQLADGVTHGGTTAKLRLGGSSGDPPLYVTASGTGQHAAHLVASGTNGVGFRARGDFAGIQAEAKWYGGQFEATLSGTGLAATGGTIGLSGRGSAGDGLYAVGGAVGIHAVASGTNGRGMDLAATGSGGVGMELNGSDRPLTAPNGIGGGALIDINGTVSFLGDGAIANNTFNVETGLRSIRSATAQGGTASTITLDASASAIDDFYTGTVVYLMAGTGLRQARIITAYNGTTKVATVSPDWKTNPASGTTFTISPAGSSIAPTAAENAAAWGQSIVGNSRTRDMYLMGYINKLVENAAGTSYTYYSYDDTTILQTRTMTRLATTVGGVETIT